MMKKERVAHIIIAIIVLVFIILRFTPLRTYFSVAMIKEHGAFLHQLVDANYVGTVGMYILAYIVVSVLSLPLAAILTLMSGFLFGPITGTFYTNIGAIIGGTISFLLYRYLFGAQIQERYAVQLASFNEEFAQNGVWYLILIRLVVVIPFFLANACASLTPISIWQFIWTTSLGVIPVSFSYAYAGSQIEYITTINDVLSPSLLTALIFLGLISALPIIVRHLRTRRRTI